MEIYALILGLSLLVFLLCLHQIRMGAMAPEGRDPDEGWFVLLVGALSAVVFVGTLLTWVTMRVM